MIIRTANGTPDGSHAHNSRTTPTPARPPRPRYPIDPVPAQRRPFFLQPAALSRARTGTKQMRPIAAREQQQRRRCAFGKMRIAAIVAAPDSWEGGRMCLPTGHLSCGCCALWLWGAW